MVRLCPAARRFWSPPSVSPKSINWNLSFQSNGDGALGGWWDQKNGVFMSAISGFRYGDQKRPWSLLSLEDTVIGTRNSSSDICADILVLKFQASRTRENGLS